MGVMKYFRHILMGHEIFFQIIDGPQNIFLCSIFVISFFKLSGLEHKISKPTIKEIEERQDMLNKSHPLSRYKANSGKDKKECLMHFHHLAIDTRYNFSVIFICLTPFPELQFGPISCMILMK